MNEVSNILIRMRELATQAASDTVSNEDREFSNREYQAANFEIDSIANTTSFNGIMLLKGTDGNEELSGSVTFWLSTSVQGNELKMAPIPTLYRSILTICLWILTLLVLLMVNWP